MRVSDEKQIVSRHEHMHVSSLLLHIPGLGIAAG